MKTLVKAFFLIISLSFIIISCSSDDDTGPDPAPELIDAMDDNYTITAEEGVNGTTLFNVLNNDVNNGIAVNPADVTITPNTNGPLTVNADGTVTVAENTPVGDYTVTYTVCENGTTPANSNCDDATVTVIVSAPDPINAMDDNYTITNEEGVNGITLSNVLDNDVNNGIVVNPADVTITPNTNGPLTVNADGTVTVAVNTPAGEHTVTYTVCENGTIPADSNCDVATVTVSVPVLFAFEAGDYNISWNGSPFKAQLTLTDNVLTGGLCVNNDIDNCDDIGPITITRNEENDLTFNFLDIGCRISPDVPGTFNGDGTIVSDNQYSFVVSGEDCIQTYTNNTVIFTKI